MSHEERKAAAELLGIPWYYLCQDCGLFMADGQRCKVMGGGFMHPPCIQRRAREERAEAPSKFARER